VDAFRPAGDDAARGAPRVTVFGPAPIVTVSIEQGVDGADEVHVHAGGQGVWVARLLAELGVDTVLCVNLGGEMGRLLQELAAAEGLRLATLDVAAANGAYVHDRRGGERRAVAEMPSGTLTRHEIDDLHGLTLIEGLASDAAVLTGPQDDHVVPADLYRRLAHDLTANGTTVVADLAGERLDAAVDGGLTLLKVSEEELERDGRVARAGSLQEAMEELVARGAANVVVTCGDERSLALVDGELHVITAPTVEVVDAKGAGDSFTAAAVAALVAGDDLLAALVGGAAAGATNVTRRGLASGRREVIDALADRVTVDRTSGCGDDEEVER
jgi:1-phosphofructokinase